MLIDGSALLAELGVSPEDLAKTIRAEIKEKTGCCASVGMGEFVCLLLENRTTGVCILLIAHLFRVQHLVGSAGDSKG